MWFYIYTNRQGDFASIELKMDIDVFSKIN